VVINTINYELLGDHLVNSFILKTCYLKTTNDILSVRNHQVPYSLLCVIIPIVILIIIPMPIMLPGLNHS